MPAIKFEYGVDFVLSKKRIVFGHHFTTIAGLRPIVRFVYVITFITPGGNEVLIL